MRLIGIGGSGREGSTTARLLEAALEIGAGMGASVTMVDPSGLDLPAYAPGHSSRPAARMLAEVAAADGVIIASPATTADSREP
ncbi:MAG: NAD(P)H-dependent oxidoreductase [Solirubrobacterales bacterium]